MNLGAGGQRALDDFELSDQLVEYHIPELLRHTVLPQQALSNARYRPTSVISAPAASRSELFWYKSQLARAREVAIVFSLRGPVPNPLYGVWQVPPAPVCSPMPCPAPPAHAALIVGYDDITRTIMVKNSWGANWTPQTQFARMSYDWIEQGMILEAISVVDVMDPSASFGVDDNPQLFMGRWSANLDGRAGVLDIYRVPGDGTALQPDRRVGTFYQDNGDAFRVNAKFDGRRLDFFIDWTNPNIATNALVGTSFSAFLFSRSSRAMAGSYRDQATTATYPFVAWKGSAAPMASTTGGPTLANMTGRWTMSIDGAPGTMDVTAVSATTRQLTARFTDESGVVRAMSGTVLANLRDVTLQMTMPSGVYAFTGQRASTKPYLMAGQFTKPGGATFGFYARRTGVVPTVPDETPDERMCRSKPWTPGCD